MRADLAGSEDAPLLDADTAERRLGVRKSLWEIDHALAAANAR
jgi:hypothetical protein